MNLDPWIKIATSPFALLLFLLALLYAGARMLWVFGWAYRAILDERDSWKDIAEAQTENVARLTSILEAGARERM